MALRCTAPAAPHALPLRLSPMPSAPGPPSVCETSGARCCILPSLGVKGVFSQTADYMGWIGPSKSHQSACPHSLSFRERSGVGGQIGPESPAFRVPSSRPWRPYCGHTARHLHFWRAETSLPMAHVQLVLRRARSGCDANSSCCELSVSADHGGALHGPTHHSERATFDMSWLNQVNQPHTPAL